MKIFMSCSAELLTEMAMVTPMQGATMIENFKFFLLKNNSKLEPD